MDYMYANNQEYCSSGCDSGWTLYLEEHSSVSPEPSFDRPLNRSPTGKSNRAANRSKDHYEEEEEEEDEDLSMVSDASSGPPAHLQDEEGGHHCNAEDSLSRSSLGKKKNRENRRRNKTLDHSSLLDDTASSPFFDFSNIQKTRSPPSMENVLEYSQGYSTTQFEVRTPYQQHYDFFQPGNQMQQQQNQW